MSFKTLSISGTSYRFPIAGANPNWGEDITDRAVAITELINSIQGNNDIPETNFNIADNQTTPANVIGFTFDTSQVRSFSSAYHVFRTDGTSVFTEIGQIQGVYTGTEWVHSIERTGDAGVVFSVTPAGQVQYTSSEIGGTYSGVITFKADALDVFI